MSPDEIRATLAKVMVERLNCTVPVDKIGWDSTLRHDLGIDSLGASELLFEIEVTFGTALRYADVDSLVTVRDAVNAISRTLQSASAT
jgi:acyl carrier protein